MLQATNTDLFNPLVPKAYNGKNKLTIDSFADFISSCKCPVTFFCSGTQLFYSRGFNLWSLKWIFDQIPQKSCFRKSQSQMCIHWKAFKGEYGGAVAIWKEMVLSRHQVLEQIASM